MFLEDIWHRSCETSGQAEQRVEGKNITINECALGFVSIVRQSQENAIWDYFQRGAVDDTDSGCEQAVLDVIEKEICA